MGSALKWAVANSPAVSEGQELGRWIFVGSFDGDLRHYNEAEALFRRHKPDQVIHLAARVGGVYENSLRMADFLCDNLAIDQNVLRLCHEFKVCRQATDYPVVQN